VVAVGVRAPPRSPLHEWRFWRVLIPCSVIVGIGVVGERGPLWFRPPDLDSPGASGAVADCRGLSLAAPCRARHRGRLYRRFLAGSVLASPRRSARKHSATNRFHRRPEPCVRDFPDGIAHQRRLSDGAWGNWFFKHRFALDRQFLGLLADYRPSDAEAREAVSRAQAPAPPGSQRGRPGLAGLVMRHDYTLDSSATTSPVHPAMAAGVRRPCLWFYSWR